MVNMKKRREKPTKHRKQFRPRRMTKLTSGITVPGVIGDPDFISSAPAQSSILKFAHRRRRNPTPAEARLCRILNQLNGGALRGRFKREHPISGRWIVDFFFPEVRLAIEVDGSIHLTEDQKRRDREKDTDCARFDITVLRITNQDVYGDRRVLIEKLRAGWREALHRENKIIGMNAEDYMKRSGR